MSFAVRRSFFRETRSLERATRLVALTLLGGAAIVPALLARRMLDADATLAEARALQAGLVSLEPRSDAGSPLGGDPVAGARSVGAVRQDSGRLESARLESPAPDLKRLATAFLAPAPAAPAEPVRFFPINEIDQAREKGPTGARAPGAPLLPPLGLSARVTDDGILLTWADHPSNPPGSVLRTEVYRWRGDEAPLSVFVGPLARSGSSEGKSYLDPVVCQGARVSYAVLSIQFDQLEGLEVRRSVLGETVSIDVPMWFRFEPLGFADGGRVRIGCLDLRTEPPARKDVEASVGEEVGRAAGLSTGWTLAALERETRQETHEVALPVFAADGSRLVENGAPVVRTRLQARSVAYPILVIRDRCGAERVVPSPPGPSRDPSR
jgi:hypothetical protein